MTIPESTAETIRKHNLLASEEGVLVAVSGGADSVALACVLKLLGYRIQIAHCDFDLRPESATEAHFVAQLSDQLGVPFHLKKFDTITYAGETGQSIQMAARSLRYTWFENILDQEGISKCATAHHRDDHVETLLLSLLKSRWPEVITGIPIIRERFVRPFLETQKTEIIEFLNENQQAWCEDPSNESDKYQRNMLRNKVIPSFFEINPSWATNLIEKSDFLKQSQLALRKALKWVPGLSGMEGELSWIDLEVIEVVFGDSERAVGVAIFLQDWGLEGREIRSGINLISAESGAHLSCKCGILWKDRTKLWLDRRAKNEIEIQSIQKSELEKGPIETKYGRWKIRLELMRLKEIPNFQKRKNFGNGGEGSEIHAMDTDQICFPLNIRNWREGDKMQALGMKGKKRLSDVFTDAKIPVFGKKGFLVFEDARQIIGLSGFRVAESVKITEKTQRVLLITIEKQ